jgi:hypothetical protein
VIDLTKFSYCESTHATSMSPWCIRELTAAGQKLTGGIDTASLCGRVRPRGGPGKGWGGWDLAVPVDPVDPGRHPGVVCKNCAAVLRQKLGLT